MLSVEVFVNWAAEIPGKEMEKNELTNQQMQQQEIIFKWHTLHLKRFKIQVTCRQKSNILPFMEELQIPNELEYYAPAI